MVSGGAQSASLIIGLFGGRAARPARDISPGPVFSAGECWLELSCVLPIHRLDRNIRQELSDTVPSPSGMESSFEARYANWLTCQRVIRSYSSLLLEWEAPWCACLSSRKG